MLAQEPLSAPLGRPARVLSRWLRLRRMGLADTAGRSDAAALRSLRRQRREEARGLGAARLQSALAQVARLQARLLSLQSVLRAAGAPNLNLVDGDGDPTADQDLVDRLAFAVPVLRSELAYLAEAGTAAPELPPCARQRRNAAMHCGACAGRSIERMGRPS